MNCDVFFLNTYSQCLNLFMFTWGHGGLVLRTFASNIRGWGFEPHLCPVSSELACALGVSSRSPRFSGIGSFATLCRINGMDGWMFTYVKELLPFTVICTVVFSLIPSVLWIVQVTLSAFFHCSLTGLQ